MDYTTLGKTGLRVSVAGLGAGGFSRLGLATGKSEANAIAIVHAALDHGVNFIDTAAAYGTEEVVGKALKSVPRDRVVISTKASIASLDGETLLAPDRVVASLDNSLRLLGTDHVDVFQCHGVRPSAYDHVRTQIVPVLLQEQAKGKFRHLGITEAGVVDHTHEMLVRALRDEVWAVVMLAFHMMAQNARSLVFPPTQAGHVGTLLMFVVRSIFARPERLALAMRELAASGALPAWLTQQPDPLGFLVHEGGASSVTDAAYRFARYEPGVDVVLFGTGDPEHLRTNIESILKPPLPAADRERVISLFGHLVGVGLDRPPQARER